MARVYGARDELWDRAATGMLAGARCVMLATVLLAVLVSSAAAQNPVLTNAESEVSMKAAKAAGVVESIDAVRTDAASASKAINPQGDESRERALSVGATAVDLVVMRGTFSDQLSKTPEGAPAPSGSAMAFVMNPADGEIAAMYVGDHAPAMPPGNVEHTVVAKASAEVAKSKAGAATRSRVRAKAATWDGICRYADKSHCYMIAQWEMSGEEKVEGTQSEQRTTTMVVPGCSSGYFVDNEEWASFHGDSYWLEIGQQMGEGKCESLWWFYAFNGPSGYVQYVGAPYVWPVSLNAWNRYGMHSLGGGNWCFMIGPNWETQAACESGFPVYSQRLQNGGEVATEQKPSFAATGGVNAEFTNGNYYQWGHTTAVKSVAGLCYSHYGEFPGNINYGTC
jgi:hypothetical protein